MDILARETILQVDFSIEHVMLDFRFKWNNFGDLVQNEVNIKFW